MLLNEFMSKWQAVRGAPYMHMWNKIEHHPLKLIQKVHDNNLSKFGNTGFSLTLSKNNFGLPLILSVYVGLLNFVYSKSYFTQPDIKKCWAGFYPQ